MGREGIYSDPDYKLRGQAIAAKKIAQGQRTRKAIVSPEDFYACPQESQADLFQ